MDILNKSKKEIIIIDNYAGKELLDILKKIDKQKVPGAIGFKNVVISSFENGNLLFVILISKLLSIS